MAVSPTCARIWSLNIPVNQRLLLQKCQDVQLCTVNNRVMGGRGCSLCVIYDLSCYIGQRLGSFGVY